MNRIRQNGKRKVVLITDGDKVARKSIELVAQKVGGRCISLSAGNPTTLTGPAIVDLIKDAHHDPVLVMLDDKGSCEKGQGETAMEYIVKHPDIEVLGVVAVASNTENIEGIEVDSSVTNEGEVVNKAVDKCGNLKLENGDLLEGDTVDVLNNLEVPLIIGTGDTGKMNGADALSKDSPITTKAVEEILHRSGYYGHY